MAFTIHITEHEWLDSDDAPYDFRSFLFRGNVFSVEENGYEMDLELATNERLVLFDGDSEHEVNVNYKLGERNPYYLSSSQNFNDAAPYYILRYYRRDGAVLESRIETPEVHDFITPERDSEWLPREQVLTVEWTDTTVPVEEVVLYSRCRVSDENDETLLHSPAAGVTRAEIDLTGEMYEDDCDGRTYISLLQTQVSASRIDSRFLAESRFELQRTRERVIRERT